MAKFMVTWAAEIEADSAEEAAEIAVGCISTMDTARNFSVTDAAGDEHDVDLSEDLQGAPPQSAGRQSLWVVK